MRRADQAESQSHRRRETRSVRSIPPTRNCVSRLSWPTCHGIGLRKYTTGITSRRAPKSTGSEAGLATTISQRKRCQSRDPAADERSSIGKMTRASRAMARSSIRSSRRRELPHHGLAEAILPREADAARTRHENRMRHARRRLTVGGNRSEAQCGTAETTRYTSVSDPRPIEIRDESERPLRQIQADHHSFPPRYNTFPRQAKRRSPCERESECRG